MKRKPGWRGRLHAHIEAARRLPFSHASGHDCASFAAGAVLAMTGQDHRSWAGQYATYAAGLRRVRESGWLDHIDYVSAHFDAIPVAQAQMGDLAAVPGDDGLALGVVGGAEVFVLRPDGLATVPLTAAKKAWRV